MDFHITKEEFLIDGRPQPLLCGEIHYFRMKRSLWETALDRLVEAGCNAVAYYVPWLVHEPEEGVFDFTGRLAPEHDLHAWIDLTVQKGLIAILRPGPYVYAETSDLGLPQWFTARYPQAHPKKYADGAYTDYGFTRYASHQAPDFLRCAERWLRAVRAEIEPYLAPKGNVWMLQLCNEIPGDDHMDENPLTLGVGQEDGLLPAYLRRRYGTQAALEEAYGAPLPPMIQVEPHHLAAANPKRCELEKRTFYYTWYYPLYFQRLRSYLSPLPPEVTLYHNAYNPKAISLHYDNQLQNPWLNVGVDCYYSLFGNLSLKEGVYFCEYGASYSRAMLANPPWIVEHECGYWNDYPQVYGPELYIWNIYAFAAGYRGINMYLFAAGENPPGLGFFGTAHNWQAPVRKDGSTAPSYGDICRSLTEIRENFTVFSAPNRCDIALGVPHTPGLIWTSTANACREAFFALKLAGFTPEVVDYEAMDAEAMSRWKAMAVVSSPSMPADTQAALARYASAGGKLLVSGCLPHLDEHRRPCTILADALRVRYEPAEPAPADQEKLVYEGVEYCVNQTIQRHISGGVPLAFRAADGSPAAVLSGTALILPFQIDVLFHDMGTLLRGLLEKLGVSPLCRMGEYLIVLPKTDGRTIVLNLHPCRIQERLVLQGIPVVCALEPYSYQIFEP